MFYILIIIAIILIALGGIFKFSNNNTSGLDIGLIAAGICLVILAYMTPQGKLTWSKIWASSATGNWLIVDRSGGQTMCHWIVISGYVGSPENSDGWEFPTEDGLAKVGGDAVVLRINKPIEQFKKTYKQKYNIPKDQPALE